MDQVASGVPIDNKQVLNRVATIMMPPQSQAEKNIVKDISHKLKKTFWNYYKDHKTDMIEEQSMTGSYFRDEHGFESSGDSSDGSQEGEGEAKK